MASRVECQAKSAQKPKLLTMDAIELTLLLKSIGFRLNSIDFDEERFSSSKAKSNGLTSAARNLSPPSSQSDHDQYVNIEISCSKSKIVSNLSYKLNDDDRVATSGNSIAADASSVAAPTSEPTKTNVCTCPKRKPSGNNNSFWEVQSTGSFANQKRPMNGLLMKSENGIDNDTSSNLLPALSTRSIALTQVLVQVLLTQYQNDIQLGEIGSMKDVDIKSIMKAFENAAQTKGLQTIDPNDELNLITPQSSTNITPTKHDAPAVSSKPEIQVNGQPAEDGATQNVAAALNDTVNTEAFTSPKSDLFTSSPNGGEHNDKCEPPQHIERDANIINNLNQARHFIDTALLVMKLNITRNMSHDASLLTVTPEVDGDFCNLPNVFNTSLAAAAAATNARNSPRLATNPRAPPPLAATGRRPSLGKPKTDSAPSARLNASTSGVQSKQSLSKLSLVRRAVSGVANRTIGGASQSEASAFSRGVTATSSFNQKSRLSTGTLTRRASLGGSNPSSLMPTANTSISSGRKSLGGTKPTLNLPKAK